MNTVELTSELDIYASRWTDELATAAEFRELLGDYRSSDGDHAANPFRRERLAGHFTASSWLVDRAGTRALLTHHRKLDRWLQPGGHADGDCDLRAVALKEAEEESGLRDLVVDAAIFDLDRHWIPEHNGVPGHWHYDVRYVVRATGSEAFEVSDESHALAWQGVAQIAADAGVDASLRRMADKWLAAKAGPNEPEWRIRPSSAG